MIHLLIQMKESEKLISKINHIGNKETYRGLHNSLIKLLNTYKQARKVGFENINIDLMIGLPTQTIQDIKETLETILELKPEHISVYSLIVEENTRIYDFHHYFYSITHPLCFQVFLMMMVLVILKVSSIILIT